MFNSDATFENLIIGGTLIFTLLIFAIILFMFQIQKKNQKYLIEKQKLLTEYHNLILQTQLEIQEQTLVTISEEIHDNVGQILSLAKLNLGTIGKTENEKDQIKINDTKQLLSKAISDLRELSRNMHGDIIAELGLKDAITTELKILQNTGQFETELIISGEIYRIESQKEMVLFRIMQESFHNAIKHSKANKIYVHLDFNPVKFRLITEDNGVGFESDNLQSGHLGIGLKSMRKRAELIGAEFSIISVKGKGTTVSVGIKRTNT